MSEIEELRAQLMEATALYEGSRKREALAARARHDSMANDPSSVLDDAKRELYKVRNLSCHNFYSRYFLLCHWWAKICTYSTIYYSTRHRFVGLSLRR